MSDHQSKHSDEQFWQAFQYVAGELSAIESEVFEQRMLEDVSLCEAVTEAALLTSSVAAARRPQQKPVVPVSVPYQQSDRSYRATAVIAVVCCCVLVAMVAANFSQFRVGSGEETLAAVPSEAELLVNAWVESSSEDASPEAEGVELRPQDLDVPDWMLTAVSLADLDHSADADGPGEG